MPSELCIKNQIDKNYTISCHKKEKERFSKVPSQKISNPLNNLQKIKSTKPFDLRPRIGFLLLILHRHRAKSPPILFLSSSRACNVLNEDECIPVKSHALHSGCVPWLSGGRSDSPYRGIAQRHIMRLWWNQSLASCGW